MFMHTLRTPAQTGQILPTDDLTEEELANWLSFGQNQPTNSNASSHQTSTNQTNHITLAPSTPQNHTQNLNPTTTNNITPTNTTPPRPHWWDFPIASNTGNLSTAYQDPLDSRNERPRDVREQQMLHLALEETAEQFLALTGRNPNSALFYPGGSYFSQWYLLQAEFEMLWAMRGSLDAPRLRLRGRWTGGVGRWGG